MKIREKTPEKATLFKDLAYGDLFRFSAKGRVLMKIRGLLPSNYDDAGVSKPRDAYVAVDLGEWHYVSQRGDNDVIWPVDGEFVEA